MSILILISSAVLCLIISLILDLNKSSDEDSSKDYDTSYNENSNVTNDGLTEKIDNLSIKINDIFKVLKSDSIKNAIAETNTYIKATINEVASIKKGVEKISNFENQTKEINFPDLDNKFLGLENKIDEIRKEFTDKFNDLSNLLVNVKSATVETPKSTEDSLLVNNEDEISENKLTTSEEEIDRDFNPGEIDLETTPIETIVENQKIDEDEEQYTMDSFLDENSNNEQDVEEEKNDIEEDSEETTIENDEEESTTDENIDDEENIESAEDEEEEYKEEDNDDDEDEIEEEEEEDEEEEKEEETENKTEDETKPSENTSGEDLATKIKKLKERLNSPTKDE